MHDPSLAGRLARLSIVLAWLVVLSPSGAGAQDEPVVHPLEEFLVLEPVGRYGRMALHTDAVEREIVSGTWLMPTEGDVETMPDGTVRRWSAGAADDEGWLRGPAMRRGYALATFDAPAEQVMLLDAWGHSVVYVNGVPRPGNPYSTGFLRCPVRLKRGVNTFLFHVSRGRLRAQLAEATGRLMLHGGDVTKPDLIIGEPIDVLAALPPIPPLSGRKVGFAVRGPAPAEAGEYALTLELLEIDEDGSEIVHDSRELTLQCAAPTDLHVRTFRSDIDGSVQYYAVRPAVGDGGDRPPALVLTLHGASVEGRGQAAAYASKPWCHIVAPTNRRPFGFDWEDWGRLDAMEVLDLATARLGTDPRRTYLTGHSMGGHGTWQVGVHFPDRFAAIAPSAGWTSFWSYTGSAQYENPTPVEQMLVRAKSASDTLALSRNYLQQGVYILHGDRDDNVPVSQARTMREHLAGYHPNFAYYERPGAKHWWGGQCVDWPPLFAFLRDNEIPKTEDQRHVEFATASPGVSSRCHWVAIEAQRRHFETSAVDLRVDPEARSFTGTTTNVARLALELAPLAGAEPFAVELDDQRFDDLPWPTDGTAVRFTRAADGTWSPAGRPDPRAKGPHRYGGFKDAFRHRFILVYGTRGTDEENRWAYAKARLDAETFWYRGNGTADLVADVDLDLAATADRSLVLYGNADTNAAWPALLADSPVQVRRGGANVGSQGFVGDDLAALFIRPRPDSDIASVGVVAGSGAPGMRLTDRLPYFVSGVGYPDLILLDVGVLSGDKGAIRAAGYFGADWSINGAEISFDSPPPP
jgi:pimeloyl-ACP methyl ester carboxylesterase